MQTTRTDGLSPAPVSKTVNSVSFLNTAQGNTPTLAFDGSHMAKQASTSQVEDLAKIIVHDQNSIASVAKRNSNLKMPMKSSKLEDAPTTIDEN